MLTKNSQEYEMKEQTGKGGQGLSGECVEQGNKKEVAPDRPIPSPTLPLPLLPSGPDGVYGLVARGDRRGPPARIVAKNQSPVATKAAELLAKNRPASV